MAKIEDWLTKERVCNRVKNCLRAEGYPNKDVVWHVFHLNPKALMRMPQFGDYSMAQLEKWLRNYEPKQAYVHNGKHTQIFNHDDLSPVQDELFTQPPKKSRIDELIEKWDAPEEQPREPDSFDLIAEWMEKAATAIDLNTKTLQSMNTRVAHIEDMLEKSKKLNEFQALIKRWET